MNRYTFDIVVEKSIEELIAELEKDGFKIGPYAKELLCREDYNEFCKINGKYQIIVVKGNEFKRDDRTTENIRCTLFREKYIELPMELICYTRKQISDKQVNNWGLVGIVAIISLPPDWNSEAYRQVFSISNEGIFYFGSTLDQMWSKNIGFLFAKEIE